MLGVHVQKAKRAKEKREKGREEAKGDEGLSILGRWILPPCSRFFTAFRIRSAPVGPRQGPELRVLKLAARELDLR